MNVKREVPKLGTPERPLTNKVDTSKPFTTCEHCKGPNYSGECWNSLHIMHAHCAKKYTPEAIDRDVTRSLARLRNELKKLKT